MVAFEKRGVFVKLSDRFHDSTIPEMQERLESLERSSSYLQHEVNDLRRINDVIKEVRVVSFEFKDKCERGVAEVNRLLEDGFEIRKEWQTDAGIVINLARWGIKDGN